MSNSKTVAELLNTAQQLSDREFEDFFEKMQVLHEKKSLDQITREEKRLLQKINAGLSSRILLRWNYLIARRDNRSITPAEHTELLKLTETIEKFDLNRLKWMAQLAEIRSIPLEQVPQYYGLTPV